MYREVALDPHCLSEFHYYGLLKTAFGFEEGRYVIAPLKEWVREAAQSVKASDLPPVKKKSVTNFLNKLQRNKSNPYLLFPNDRTGIANDIEHSDWQKWVAAQCTYREFSTIVSERESEKSIGYSDIIDGHGEWIVPKTTWIDRDDISIVGAISSLLNLSKELIIVDQYFRLASNKVLHGIVQEMQQSQQIERILLVSSVATADPIKVFEREFLNRYRYVPSFSYLIAPERYFHDRYMITDRAAVKAGHGFSVGVIQGTQADKLSLSICGKEERDETLAHIEGLKAGAEQQVIILN
ncbi:hypothetical protein [Ferrimonas pelagia]|uniref:Uncharacterized protein n=1 Tax=Ferrimonas pelagia TaxID=1177826 RepID=A0ABP9EXS0_9GAMM